nr:hypothetical protein [Angustibacter aerolatus]
MAMAEPGRRPARALRHRDPRRRPLLPVTDSASLAQHTDGVLMVVGAKTVRRNEPGPQPAPRRPRRLPGARDHPEQGTGPAPRRLRLLLRERRDAEQAPSVRPPPPAPAAPRPPALRAAPARDADRRASLTAVTTSTAPAPPPVAPAAPGGSADLGPAGQAPAPVAPEHTPSGPGTTVVALLAAFALGLDLGLVPRVTTGLVVVGVLAPVWIGTLRRYRAAPLLLLGAVVLVVSGVVLAQWSGETHRVNHTNLRLDAILIVTAFGGLGLLLWARTVVPLRWVAAAYGLGWIAHSVLAGFGTQNPWKFGLALPTAVVVLSLCWGRRALLLVALTVLALLGAVNDYRAYTGFCLLVAAAVVWQGARRGGSRRPARLVTLVLLALVVVAGYYLGTAALTQGVLGEATAERTQTQIRQSGSLLAGGRPEWTATVRLMSERPLGYGFGVVPTTHDVSLGRQALAPLHIPTIDGYAEHFMFGGEFKPALGGGGPLVVDGRARPAGGGADGRGGPLVAGHPARRPARRGAGRVPRRVRAVEHRLQPHRQQPGRRHALARRAVGDDPGTRRRRRPGDAGCPRRSRPRPAGRRRPHGRSARASGAARRSGRTAGTGMRVLQSFAPPRPTTNPYLVLLQRNLPEPVRSSPFSWRLALTGRYDVLHVHWPEVLLRGSSRLRTLSRQARFALLLARLRLRRTPVVRTRHNLTAHEPAGRLEGLLVRALDRRTRVSVLLNPVLPAPGPERSVVVLHGHYRDWFAAHPRDEAVPGRLLFFGLVRPYKQVPEPAVGLRRGRRPGRHPARRGQPPRRGAARAGAAGGRARPPGDHGARARRRRRGGARGRRRRAGRAALPRHGQLRRCAARALARPPGAAARQRRDPRARRRGRCRLGADLPRRPHPAGAAGRRRAGRRAPSGQPARPVGPRVARRRPRARRGLRARHRGHPMTPLRTVDEVYAPKQNVIGALRLLFAALVVVSHAAPLGFGADAPLLRLSGGHSTSARCRSTGSSCCPASSSPGRPAGSGCATTRSPGSCASSPATGPASCSPRSCWRRSCGTPGTGRSTGCGRRAPRRSATSGTTCRRT